MKAIYEYLNVNRDKILSILLFPEVMSVAEERISNFFRTTIGNMPNNELCLLVRFITGYDVVPRIKSKLHLMDYVDLPGNQLHIQVLVTWNNR